MDFHFYLFLPARKSHVDGSVFHHCNCALGTPRVGCLGPLCIYTIYPQPKALEHGPLLQADQ